MANYKYTVIDKKGSRITGEREGSSQTEIADYLHSQGYTVVGIEEKIGIDFKSLARTEIGGIPVGDKLILVKQLSTMVSAGIPLLQAIDILIQQTEKESLKAKLEEVHKSIQSGTPLSESFKRVGGIFTEVQINLLAAGEKSGNLVEILQQVSDDIEKSKNLRGKILGAMIYPAIIFIVMIIVVAVMIVFMIPQVKELYGSFGETELPFITQMFISASELFTNIAFLIVLVISIIGGILLYRYYNSTEGGRIIIDRLKLKIPVFGNLMAKVNISEFCRLTSMLISSGLPILDVLQIVAKASDNKLFSDVLYKAHDELIKGNSLSLSMAKHNKYNVYPLILLKIIATGEESGKLDLILQDMSKYYENEIEQITSNLTKLMEPFILVVAGGLVALLAVGIYLPMYQLGTIVNG